MNRHNSQQPMICASNRGSIIELKNQLKRNGQIQTSLNHDALVTTIIHLFDMLDFYDEECHMQLAFMSDQDEYYKDKLAKLNKFNLITNKEPE